MALFRCALGKDSKMIDFLPNITLVLKDKAFIAETYLQIGWLIWYIQIIFNDDEQIY